MSETGSLDRARVERRKKGGPGSGGGGLESSGVGGVPDSLSSASATLPTVSGRVEGTRVNTGLIIDELLKNTKLDHLEESEGKGDTNEVVTWRFKMHQLFQLFEAFYI